MIDEPVAEIAPLALDWARDCRVDPATGASCGWYHGAWPLLRLLGIAPDPTRDSAFFEEALSGVLSRYPDARLLVAGAADFSMLAHVLDAADRRGAGPTVTIVDACDTPLRMSRWYAERLGRAIETIRGDLVEFAPARSFDAICTHSLLGHVEPARRSALFSRWHALLRPGGCVITVNAVRGGGSARRAGFSGDEAAGLRAIVEKRGPSVSAATGVPLERLHALVRDYAARRRVHPLGSADELRALFEAAGFAIGTMEAVAPAMPLPESGGAQRVRERLRVIAMRR